MQSNPKNESKVSKAPHHHVMIHELFDDVKETAIHLKQKESKYMDNFKLHHKITFAFVVFFAINLLWYGMWEIISILPILSNPYWAIIIGAIILIGTGYFYENLISVNFDKKVRKKTNPEAPPPEPKEPKDH